MDRLVEVDAHEGPVYVPGEHALYFTTVRRPPARVDPASGARTLLVDGFNSPNDVVVKSDGTIWFTDPSYGWLQGFRPAPDRPDGVHRLDPRTGEVVTVAESFDKPNGLCFSPDESILYVTDNGAGRHLKAFDVPDGRRLEGECVVAEFCFGGPERDLLFITSDTAIHAVGPARGRGLARAGAIPNQTKGPSPWPSSGPAPSSTTPALPPSSQPPRSTRTRAASAW
jgi:sugar lactone lactonase YvrE